jgi:hypothetical protein
VRVLMILCLLLFPCAFVRIPYVFVLKKTKQEICDIETQKKDGP